MMWQQWFVDNDRSLLYQIRVLCDNIVSPASACSAATGQLFKYL